MGVFNPSVLTEQGKSLIAKSVAGICDITFTKIAISDTPITEELSLLTDIGAIKQSEKVASVVMQSENRVKASASFNNAGLTAGYYIRNIGLYAMDPTEGEILYSVSVAEESTATADWMPPFSGIGVSSLMVDILTAVSNTSSVNVMVDPTANATVAQILEVNEHLTALDNTIITTTKRALKGSIAGGLKINKVSGKSEQDTTTGANLWVPPNPATLSGVTLTIDEDGAFVLNGTCTNSINFETSIKLSAGEYWISDSARGNFPADNYARTQLYFSDGENLVQINNDQPANQVGSTVLTTEKLAYLRIRLQVGHKYSNCKLYPMLNKGSSALPYEPYTGGKPSPSPDYPQEIRAVEVSEVKALGENLFNIDATPSWNEETKSTLKKVDAETFISTNSHYSGGGNGIYIGHFVAGEVLTISGQYKVSSTSISAINIITNKTTGDMLTAWVGIKTDLTPFVSSFRIVEDGDYYYRPAYDEVYKDVNSVTFTKVMINKGETALPYEPYKESSITLSQPVTLYGIPVSSGGNYTDENGQKWVCDEIDVERGVLVKRSQYLKLTAGVAGYSEDEKMVYYPLSHISIYGAKIFCSHFNNVVTNGTSNQLKFTGFSALGEFNDFVDTNDVEIVCILATSTDTPLTTADQIALRSLLSHNGVTNLVTNSLVNPVMEVEYGTNKVGAHTLTGLLTAQRTELKLNQ